MRMTPTGWNFNPPQPENSLEPKLIGRCHLWWVAWTPSELIGSDFVVWPSHVFAKRVVLYGISHLVMPICILWKKLVQNFKLGSNKSRRISQVKLERKYNCLHWKVHAEQGGLFRPVAGLMIGIMVESMMWVERVTCYSALGAVLRKFWHFYWKGKKRIKTNKIHRRSAWLYIRGAGLSLCNQLLLR